ncbi:hypothetical protein [Solirubrobacter soli]|uniref:hypothetical protein n=1 Tax=Solirubrobacter soli TaxID=363832 RepID=UPI0004201DA8|nr:hypothetical protein [Solirubrobacter soli]
MGVSEEENGNGTPAGEPLSPHPLVVGLAASLFGKKTPRQAYDLATTAKSVKFRNGPEAKKSLGGDPVAKAIKTFVDSRSRTELVKLAGYLGDAVDMPGSAAGDGRWQVMFFDDTAENYIAMRVQDIAFRDRIKEDKAAFGELDVLWIKADAQVVAGGRTQSLIGRFTSGEFVRAGDFRSSMSGGTMGSVSDLGPLCTAFTPCCCNRYSS